MGVGSAGYTLYFYGLPCCGGLRECQDRTFALVLFIHAGYVDEAWYGVRDHDGRCHIWPIVLLGGDSSRPMRPFVTELGRGHTRWYA